jgi:hypothetical protein
MVPDETTHARAEPETPLVAAIIGHPTWADIAWIIGPASRDYAW